eukprot:5508661-Lingulodinium_polyedra.AAC.1
MTSVEDQFVIIVYAPPCDNYPVDSYKESMGAITPWIGIGASAAQRATFATHGDLNEGVGQRNDA